MTDNENGGLNLTEEEKRRLFERIAKKREDRDYENIDTEKYVKSDSGE